MVAVDLTALGSPAHWWAIPVLLVILVIASVTDLSTGKIPNWLTYSGALIGLIGHTVVGGLSGDQETMGLVDALLGLLVGFIPLFVVLQMGGIGGGDAKLMGVIGALAGWKFALVALFYGLGVAAIIGIAMMIRRRILIRTFVRIWRFLMMAVSPKHTVDPASKDSPKVAIGFAFAVGSLIALLGKFWFHSFAGDLFRM
ncbi:MAG: prepilin peptidase [Phycisphaerae bacterium]